MPASRASGLCSIGKRTCEDKVRAWEQKGNHQKHPPWVNRQEGLALFQGGGGGADGGAHGGGKKRPAQIQNPAGSGKRFQKRAAAALRNQTVPPPPQPFALQNGAANTVDINARRVDGRYYYHTDGTQICYKHSRFRDGCGKACTHVPRRAHVCEFCRQPHRTIDCPVVVNWQPPANDGKGKGKGKDFKGKGGGKGKWTAPF